MFVGFTCFHLNHILVVVGWILLNEDRMVRDFTFCCNNGHRRLRKRFWVFQYGENHYLIVDLICGQIVWHRCTQRTAKAVQTERFATKIISFWPCGVRSHFSTMACDGAPHDEDGYVRNRIQHCIIPIVYSHTCNNIESDMRIVRSHMNRAVA